MPIMARRVVSSDPRLRAAARSQGWAMAEDPIKIFATHAERLPRVDDAQTFREAIEKVILQVPVAGPITTFVASRFWAPSASRRLRGRGP